MSKVNETIPQKINVELLRLYKITKYNYAIDEKIEVGLS